MFIHINRLAPERQTNNQWTVIMLFKHMEIHNSNIEKNTVKTRRDIIFRDTNKLFALVLQVICILFV